VLRKILIMASFVFFSDMAEKAWFLGSAVMVVSMTIHAAAKPYEDSLIDWCEFFSLVSTIFIFQSGVVFKVLNDPSHPQTSEDARTLSRVLETTAVYLLLSNVIVAVYIEVRVLRLSQNSGEDYRVMLLKENREAAKAELANLDEEIEEATEKAAARDSVRVAVKEWEHGQSTAVEMEQANPMADQDDEETAIPNQEDKKSKKNKTGKG